MTVQADKLFVTTTVQNPTTALVNQLLADKLYVTVVVRANYTPDPPAPEDNRITGGGGGSYPGYTSPVYRVHPEFDEARGKKKRKKRIRNDGGNIVIEGPTEVQTGIVEVNPVRDALGEYERKRMEAERLRIQKLKALRETDDDWLMGS